MMCLLWGWAVLSGRTRKVRNSKLPPDLALARSSERGWDLSSLSQKGILEE